MMNRNTFLREGLARFYTLERESLTTTLNEHRELSGAFTSNPANAAIVSLVDRLSDKQFENFANANLRKPDGSFVSREAEAFYAFTTTSRDLGRVSTYETCLSKLGVNPELLEVILDDFRGRTAQSTTRTVDGKPETVFVSRGEAVVGFGGKAATFAERVKHAETLLTGKKTSTFGVFSSKSKYKTFTDFTDKTRQDLVDAIAVLDYQRELKAIEIPAENMRVSQLSSLKVLEAARASAAAGTDAAAWTSLANSRFKFLHRTTVAGHGGTVTDDARIEEIMRAALAPLNGVMTALSGPTFADVYSSKTGAVSTKNLTGQLQAKIEEQYNALFGMDNLRDRNPGVVGQYGTLATLLINEAMAQSKQPGGITDDWIKNATSVYFPRAYVESAVDHAKHLQEVLDQYSQVRVVAKSEGDTLVEEVITDHDAAKAELPEVVAATGIMTDAVAGVMNGLIDANPDLSERYPAGSIERQVMAQILVREMTINAYRGGPLKAIHVQNTENLNSSLLELRRAGQLPNLEQINADALGLFMEQREFEASPYPELKGQVVSVPNETLLAQVYQGIFAGQAAKGVTFDVALYSPENDKTPVNSGNEGVVLADIPQGVLAETFGMHFLNATMPGQRKLVHAAIQHGKVPSEKQPQEPGAMGLYGVLKQEQMAREFQASEVRKNNLIAKGLVPSYDGYKYKLLTKSSYYKSQYNKYFQQYMNSGGPAAYFAGMESNHKMNSYEKEHVQEHVIDPPPPPPDTPEYDINIRDPFAALTRMHDRLVQRVAGSNNSLMLNNTIRGRAALGFHSALVRSMNSKVANIVLREVSRMIEEKGIAEENVAEFIAELSAAKDDKGKPIIPTGITISEDGKQVSFFGLTYSRVVDPDTKKPTVYTHYAKDGAPVPPSTMITIATHNSNEVREIAPQYMNLPENATLFDAKTGIAPTGSAMKGFITKEVVDGVTTYGINPDALKEDPVADVSRLGTGTLDKGDKTDSSRIDRLNDNLKENDGMYVSDDVPTA